MYHAQTFMLIKFDINIFAILGLPATLRRLFGNKMLLLSISASTVLSVALVNFGLLRNDFFRSRYIDVSAGDEYSEYQQTQQSVVNPKQIIQPISGSLIMMSGVIITRFNPRARYLAGWNIFVYSMAAILFASYAFVGCEDTAFYDEANCTATCNKEIFAPICVNRAGENATYYSACYAGCNLKIDEVLYSLIFITGISKASVLYIDTIFKSQLSYNWRHISNNIGTAI